MSLPRLAVKRPITTAMLLASVLLVGAIAVVRLPLAWLPEIDAPFIGVEVTYPNSHPRQVEKEITKPIEEALATLSGVKKMTTTSRADGAQIILEFDWGQELDVVRMKVSEKIDQVRASLPDDVVNVVIFSFNTSDIPVVQGRIAATGVDLSQNYDLLETRVVNPLRRVPGVARVDLNGIKPPELFIDLKLDKVKEHGIDVGRLVRQLDGVSQNLVLGQVDEGGLRYTVRSLAAFDSLDTLPDLPIDERGLRLGDIARIRYEEPLIEFGRHLAGKAAIAFDVYKESTANTVEVVQAVNRVLHDEIDRDPLLAGIEVFVWQDQGQEILDGLNGLKSAGLIGALLATLCLYFFLRRLDATLIVSLSIPFSILAACGVFYFLGGSLNILSMMGLMLAVGMLVDNAVVVLEAIDRRLRAGVERRAAALEGAGQVLMAVTASTATTLIVFLPLVVGSGTALTTWLKEVGLVISIALACSLFSSLTLIPLMSAHLLRSREPRRVRPVEWLEERYVRVLGWTLRHRGKTFGFLMLGLTIGILPFVLGLVKTAMFSAVVNKRMYLTYEFADFAYKSDAERAVDQVEGFLFGHSKELGIESVYSYFTENEAGTTITLDREDLDDEAAKKLRTEIRDGLPTIPGVRVFFQEEAEEGGSATYFSVKTFGPDSGVLYDPAA